MFDKKKYHKEYMQKYRQIHKLTTEQIIKRRLSVKKSNDKNKKNPEWVEKNRKRIREYQRKKRLDPEYRKDCYRRHTKWAREHKEYINKKQRERNKKPENKLKQRIRELKNKYGLSYEQYQKKLITQEYKCPICKNILSNGYVDHNHSTEQIRDLLCNSCNRWIGFIETKYNLVQPMIEYLNKWNKQTA